MARRTKLSKTVKITSVVVVVLAALIAAVALVPVPYVVHRPGPTVNVLGTQGETEVFEFSESDDPSLPKVRPATDDEGQLRMVTVSEVGGPGSQLHLMELIEAKLNPAADVIRYKDLYDETVTAQQIEEAGAAQMTSSHSSASIAALDFMGVPMESTLTIEGASPGSDAEGKVEAGDILRSIRTPDGIEHAVDRPSVPFDIVKVTPPDSTLVITVDRAGDELEIPIITVGPNPDGEQFEGSRMGIYLTADTELPIDVTIHLERIGGPSAGLIFALGIIDRLSPEDITGGKVFAGTGALSFAGDVLPIGGVKQKMYGAKRDGAEVFLVPQDNCDEVIGNTPDGLQVIPVKTLAGAAAIVEAIGAGTQMDFPSCEVD